MNETELTVSRIWIRYFPGAKSARIGIYDQLNTLISNGVPLQQALTVMIDLTRSTNANYNAGIVGAFFFIFAPVFIASWFMGATAGIVTAIFSLIPATFMFFTLSARKFQEIALEHWRAQNRSGHSLGRSIAGWVPAQEQMVIDAGEAGGAISEALNQSISLANSGSQIISTILGGLLYPLFILSAVIAVLYGFGEFMVPKLGSVYSPEKWTGIAAFVRDLSRFIAEWTIPIILGGGMLIGITMSTMPVWTGPTRLFVDKLAPWSLYRVWQGSAFLMGVSSLMRAGIPLTEALNKLRINASPYLKERIDATLLYNNSGFNFGEALHKSGHSFPETDIIQNLRVFANFPNFEESMQRLSQEWVDDSVETVRRSTRTMNIISMLILTAMIATIAGGLFDVQQQISSAARTGGL